jgi:malate dehydrogenase
LTPEKLAGIIARTRDRGAEIVSLLGSGSAYYSPSAAAEEIMESVLNDSGRTLTVSVCLEGEYGLTDVAIGVPCRIGREGAEAVVELELSAAEREAFLNSARAVKDTIKLLEIP